MEKFIAVLFFLIAVVLLNPSGADAAKKFVPKKSSGKSSSVKGTSIPAVVRYRPDKMGLLLSFSNFSGIDSVSYLFTYNTNGMPQGAGGSINANNNPTAERTLLFGTCSTSVCTYHYNLTNAKLTLTAKYTNGATRTKLYRIKTYN